jgi:hypothetical protein
MGGHLNTEVRIEVVDPVANLDRQLVGPVVVAGSHGSKYATIVS